MAIVIVVQLHDMPAVQILGVEHRRRRQSYGAGPHSDAPAPELDNSAAIKAAGSGAHVVAPCAHDAPCPMEVRMCAAHVRPQKKNLSVSNLRSHMEGIS